MSEWSCTERVKTEMKPVAMPWWLVILTLWALGVMIYIAVTYERRTIAGKTTVLEFPAYQDERRMLERFQREEEVQRCMDRDCDRAREADI